MSKSGSLSEEVEEIWAILIGQKFLNQNFINQTPSDAGAQFVSSDWFPKINFKLNNNDQMKTYCEISFVWKNLLLQFDVVCGRESKRSNYSSLVLPGVEIKKNKFDFLRKMTSRVGVSDFYRFSSSNQVTLKCWHYYHSTPNPKLHQTVVTNFVKNTNF